MPPEPGNAPGLPFPLVEPCSRTMFRLGKMFLQTCLCLNCPGKQFLQNLTGASVTQEPPKAMPVLCLPPTLFTATSPALLPAPFPRKKPTLSASMAAAPSGFFKCHGLGGFASPTGKLPIRPGPLQEPGCTFQAFLQRLQLLHQAEGEVLQLPPGLGERGFVQVEGHALPTVLDLQRGLAVMEGEDGRLALQEFPAKSGGVTGCAREVPGGRAGRALQRPRKGTRFRPGEPCMEAKGATSPPGLAFPPPPPSCRWALPGAPHC